MSLPKLERSQNIKDKNVEVSTRLGSETMTDSEHSLREFPYITGVSSHLTGEIR